jgi:hypothetical protein
VGLLSVLPGPVLRRLDDWARRKAQARAERRRRALQAARQQG